MVRLHWQWHAAAPMDSNPGHRALRVGRTSQLGGMYLVTFAPHARRSFFCDFQLACDACKTFSASADRESAVLLAWVLMPNHFHGLIRLDGQPPLSRGVELLDNIVRLHPPDATESIPNPLIYINCRGIGTTYASFLMFGRSTE